jgi:hypothetical protein
MLQPRGLGEGELGRLETGLHLRGPGNGLLGRLAASEGVCERLKECRRIWQEPPVKVDEAQKHLELLGVRRPRPPLDSLYVAVKRPGPLSGHQVPQKLE